MAALGFFGLFPGFSQYVLCILDLKLVPRIPLYSGNREDKLSIFEKKSLEKNINVANFKINFLHDKKNHSMFFVIPNLYLY